MFELASFCHRRGTDRLHLLPLHLSNRVLSVKLGIAAAYFLAITPSMFDPALLTTMVGSLPFLLPMLATSIFMFHSTVEAKKVHLALENLKRFEVRNAQWYALHNLTRTRCPASSKFL